MHSNISNLRELESAEPTQLAHAAARLRVKVRPPRVAPRASRRLSYPRWQVVGKRAVDILAAGSLLVLLAPVLLLIAIAVAFDSHNGKVIYSSRRVGKNGVEFDCYKFRTMMVNAHVMRATIAHLNERDGVLFKVTNDPRVTAVGRFLRKFSFDELPQLWNVLHGEMSLVGPRPPLPEECDLYDEIHTRRLEVVPGVTGLWQIKARQDPSFEAYIKHDLEYIDNWSLGLDLKILAKTIPVVVRGTGS